MALIDDVGDGPVGIDTSLFIYFVEENERFLPVIESLFAAADDERCALVTSALTLMEVLVVPYRVQNLILAQRYEALLTHSRGIRLVDITGDHLRMAAQLRAATGVTTPDALQLAAALGAGCSAFVTNDRRLTPLPGLRIIQLGTYAA